MAEGLSKDDGYDAGEQTIRPKSCQIAAFDQPNHPGAGGPAADEGSEGPQRVTQPWDFARDAP